MRLNTGLKTDEAGWEYVLFFFLILVHLVPVWAFTYCPSQDGPNHLANAYVHRHYQNPEIPIFRQFYSFNKKIVPTWFIHLILTGFFYLIPALMVEKIFLSVYIILFPLSVRYAARVINPDSGFLAFLAFPFIYNSMFNRGFYGFFYSLAAFFFILGYWLKNREKFTKKKILTLTFLFLLMYFIHVVSLIMLAVGIASLIAFQITLSLIQGGSDRRLRFQSLWKVFKKSGLPAFFAALPALILALLFFSPLLSRTGEVSTTRYAAGALVKRFFSLYALVSFDKNEMILTIALVCLFAVVAGAVLLNKVKNRQLSRWDELFFLALVCILIYILTPETIERGGSINTRVSLFPYFILILWFGGQTFRRRSRCTIMIAAAAISLILLGMHTAKYAELNDYLDEYLSGISRIKANTTLLPLSFSHHGRAPSGGSLSLVVKPFLHTSGYIVIQRNVVDLSNYEALHGTFPMVFRPHLSPWKHLDQIEAEPPRVELFTYKERTGRDVDYVLTWMIEMKEPVDEDVLGLLRQLEEGYTLICESSKRGVMRLYRRKDL